MGSAMAFGSLPGLTVRPGDDVSAVALLSGYAASPAWVAKAVCERLFLGEPPDLITAERRSPVEPPGGVLDEPIERCDRVVDEVGHEAQS
jgi:hypothetical protein